LRQEEEVEDTSDGGGQDLEEELEHELEQLEEEEHEEEEGHYKEEARHYEDEVVGVMDLFQDPHPRAYRRIDNLCIWRQSPSHHP
jgi:Zn-dependent protease with chaperone function